MRTHQYIKIFTLFILFDLVVITLHLWLSWDFKFFHIDHEYNLPTAYQTIKLLCIGLLIIRSFKNVFSKLLGVGLWYIAIDEWFVLHERTENIARFIAPETTNWLLTQAHSHGYRSSSWVLLLSPIIVCVVTYIFSMSRKWSAKQQQVLFLVCFCFLVVILMEILGSRPNLSTEIHFAYVTVEESAELFGISLLSLLPLKKNLKS